MKMQHDLFCISINTCVCVCLQLSENFSLVEFSFLFFSFMDTMEFNSSMDQSTQF